MTFEIEIKNTKIQLCIFSIVLERKYELTVLNLNSRIMSKHIFCSTLSEFEKFLLCERILINVTTCQNETLS
jgi:hypothetical protein